MHLFKEDNLTVRTSLPAFQFLLWISNKTLLYYCNHSIKPAAMKKILLGTAIILLMAACGNSGTNTSTGTDTGVGTMPDMGAGAGTTGTGTMGSDTGVDTASAPDANKPASQKK